ncbi:MAG: DNA repair protein RecN, partial [bacterium]
LNIITGETGAGKSILIGALATLLGERTSVTVLREGEAKAFIEGHFDYRDIPELKRYLRENELDNGDDLLILRREVLSSRRSRAFVNDTPVTLDEIEKIADMLVDLHGQHEHQSLLDVGEHIRYLDAFGGLIEKFNRVADDFDQAEAYRLQLDALYKKQNTLTERRDYLKFQLDEICKIDPQPGEEVELNAEEKRLAHSTELRDACTNLIHSLYEGEGAALEILGNALLELENISAFGATFGDMQKEINTALISVEEVAKTLQSYAAKIDVNPERLEEVRTRLAAFAQLKKKYSSSFEGVIEKKGDLETELAQIDTLDEQIEKLKKLWHSAVGCYTVSAIELSQMRKNAAQKLQQTVPNVLAEIGMAKCSFEVNMAAEAAPEGWCEIDGQRVQANRNGIDRVEFYISANPGQPPRPLAKIVSGGEISRVMLALKSLIAYADHIPILIFDEIDIGISGRVAQAVGKKLRKLAKSHQIIVITHLPQIAGAGHCHFLVEKTQTDATTTSFVRKLREHEREHAIAQLLAGHEITETHLESARELMRHDS